MNQKELIHTLIKTTKHLSISALLISLSACGGGNANLDNAAIGPTAKVLNTSTPVDTSLVLLVGNDDSYSFILVTPPRHGAVSQAGGVVTYTPDAGFMGQDSFTYKLGNGLTETDTSTVNIEVVDASAVQTTNHSPSARPLGIITPVNTPAVIALPGRDADGDPLTYRLKAQPSHGSISTTGQGIVTYTPNPNYQGPDQFTYQVNDGKRDSNIARIGITVSDTQTRENRAPVTANATARVTLDTPAKIALQGSDADGDVLQYTVLTQPAHGALALDQGIVIYTPDPHYIGADSFTYKASDGQQDSNTSEITLHISAFVIPDSPPTARPIYSETQQDSAQLIVLEGSDKERDALHYLIVTQPEHGTLTLDGNRVTYAPDRGYNGPDHFAYKVNDGALDSNIATVGINVKPAPANKAPVARNISSTTAEEVAVDIPLEATDPEGAPITYAMASSPAHGVVTLAGSTATYTPNGNYNGNDHFSYTANDGVQSSSPAVVTITVTPVNDPPIANAGADAEVNEGESITLDGSASSDPDAGDTLSYSWSPAANLDDASLQNPTYTAPLVTGDTPTEFTLTVTDSGGLSSTDTVTITTREVLGSPSNLTATAGNSHVTLSWDAAPGATAHDVCYATETITDPANCGSHAGGTLLTDVASPLDITGLSNDTEYFFVVIPRNATISGAASSVASATPSAPITSGKLNDTGITLCGDYADDGGSGNHNNALDCTGTDPDGDPIPPGQDALSGRDVTHNDDSDGHAGFSFTKLDASGAELPASATDWSCVKDNVTGLIWEVKTTSGLHDRNDRYNWYNTDAATNGGGDGYADDDGNICHGYDAADSATYCNTQAYVARVNAEGLCGATDWRMPQINELLSIADLSRSNPAIDTDYFPNTVSGSYWSGTPYANNASDAWGVQFYFGREYWFFRNGATQVRLVRSGL